MRRLPNKHQGFTLVELVTVIVILGIVATSITSFLRFGTKSYTDTAERDALISTARFAIERLNREVRHALPNSIRTLGTNHQCLEFTPIDQSVTYLELPVAPEVAKDNVEVLMLTEPLKNTTKNVAVYALNSADIYNKTSGVIEPFSSINYSGTKSSPSTIQFASARLFAAESPTKRLFFIDVPVSYCIENEQLVRYQGYSGYAGTGQPNSVGVVMADFVKNFSSIPTLTPFQTVPATLQRNSIALMRFKFSRNDEEILFSHEVQVPNVP